jgi:hypothetical protein
MDLLWMPEATVRLALGPMVLLTAVLVGRRLLDYL